jgi:uncharacterized protein YndB with AHSA1/START domain
MSKREAFSVERAIEIVAPVDTVFSFFTDNKRFAAWWGAGSSIEPRVGGKVEVVLPGGVKAGGVVEVFEPPRRIRFSWGYSGSKTIPIGASRLEITLEPVAAGTRVRLLHSGIPTQADIPEQAQGWRYHMALFGKAVSAVAHARMAAVADEWFAAWNTPDAAECKRLLGKCAAPGVTFRDQFSATDGAADLEPHLAAFHVHMPGMKIARAGEPQISHHTCLVAWDAKGADGSPMGSGRNWFEFAPDGRIAKVFGYWG